MIPVGNWRIVNNYEGLYLVNDQSLIFSIKRKRIINPTHKEDGYLQIKLYKCGKPKMHYSHRLAAIAFIPNQQNKPFINHKDGNKRNNNIENLEWCTNSENTVHSFKMGLQISLKNGNHPKAKKVIDKSNGKIFSCIKEAAQNIGLKPGTLRAKLYGEIRNETSLILA